MKTAPPLPNVLYLYRLPHPAFEISSAMLVPLLNVSSPENTHVPRLFMICLIPLCGIFCMYMGGGVVFVILRGTNFIIFEGV